MSAKSKEISLQDILTAVYQGAVAECEAREADGSLRGNGHHMAQKIQDRVKKELIRRGMHEEPRSMT